MMMRKQTEASRRIRRRCMVAALVASAAALTLWADNSGMSFWKDDNYSATNRPGAASCAAMPCATTFVTTPRGRTVVLEGCNLDTRPTWLLITIR